MKLHKEEYWQQPSAQWLDYNTPKKNLIKVNIKILTKELDILTVLNGFRSECQTYNAEICKVYIALQSTKWKTLRKN